MPRIQTTVLVVGLVLAAAFTMGTSAFTTAEIERQANIDVVADDQGLLALTDGNSGDLVFQNSDEQLEIDLTAGTADGANTDARFVLGDEDSPSTAQAFTVTNNDAESHDITVEYSEHDSNDASNLQFEFYDSSDTLVGTADEEGNAATLSASADETFYVIVVIDTGDGATDVVTSGENYTGTLTLSIDDGTETPTPAA